LIQKGAKLGDRVIGPVEAMVAKLRSHTMEIH
jgi:hypothetical protein